MPTEEQNTVKLTDDQKKLASDLFARASNGEFHKDPANPPANPHPHMKVSGVDQHDDKQF